MNDISQRLRESAKETFYDPLKSELNEAASHIEKLEAALREIADASSTLGVATCANYYAIAKRALNEPMSEPEARIAINNARKALEGKDD